MSNSRMICTDEKGFVLIAAMVILVLLSIIGIATTKTSTTELMIAGNDRRAKHAFYKADGGTEVAMELLEQNYSCANGFNTSLIFNNDNASDASFFSIGGVDIFDAQFSRDDKIKDVAGATLLTKIGDIPSDTIRSLRIPDNPANRVNAELHTNIAIFGQSGFAEGSAIQMASGDRGKGYSASGGGGVKDMNLIAEFDGASNTVGKIHLDYVHLIGDEGECIY